MNSIEEDLELADLWAKGVDSTQVDGWRATAKRLADEVRRLRAADAGLNDLVLVGWNRVAPDCLPEPVKTVLVVDASGRKGIGFLIAHQDHPLGACWSVNGSSGMGVQPPLYWRDYPTLPSDYDY